MRTMLAITAIAAGVGVGGCGPEPKTCPVLVAGSDTLQVYTIKDQLVVAAVRDTLPKPYAMCVTLYANARDTLPKPR